MDRKSFLKAGHTPTLLAAFLYFDLAFMVWVLLGPLGVQIAADLGLTHAQKGLMVATPVLAGALLRLVMGVLVDHLKQTGADVLLRGVRSVSDFDYEQQLVGMYRRMVPELEILYMPPAAELAFISSTLVREVALHGGDVSCFVPESIAAAVNARIALQP